MARHGSPLRRPDSRGVMRFDTESRRLLVLLNQTVTRADIARPSHVSEAAVGAWLCGVARPDFEAAYVLEVRFGIPMSGWALPPNANPICVDAPKLKSSAATAAQ